MLEIIAGLGLIVFAGGVIATVIGFFLDGENWVYRGVAAAIVGLIAMAPAFAKIDADERAAFMAACTKDRKVYECTALWRAGRNGTPLFIPTR